MTKNYVYLMQQVDDGPVKVGYSTNVCKRHIDIQHANPLEIKFIFAVEIGLAAEARKVEAMMIRRLWKDRIRGEWFDGRCLSFAKMILLEQGTPIKTLEFWEPGLYGDDNNRGKAHWLDAKDRKAAFKVRIT